MEAQARYKRHCVIVQRVFSSEQALTSDVRMRNASILLVTIKALGNEIAKNLVLAGIGSLTVLDSEAVVEEDLGAQFLIDESHVGQNVCWPFLYASATQPYPHNMK